MVIDILGGNPISPAQLREAADAVVRAGASEDTYLTKIYVDAAGQVIGWEQLGGKH